MFLKSNPFDVFIHLNSLFQEIFASTFDSATDERDR